MSSSPAAKSAVGEFRKYLKRPDMHLHQRESHQLAPAVNLSNERITVTDDYISGVWN